jgi:hypothetical protein
MIDISMTIISRLCRKREVAWFTMKRDLSPPCSLIALKMSELFNYFA